MAQLPLKLGRQHLIALLILLSPFIYFFIGLPAPSLGSDAAGYSAYATNLIEGKGYSLDGSTFSNFREPGYPLLLAGTYALFGNENTLPIVILQTVMLGVLGVMVALLLLRVGNLYVSAIAGFATALLPSYGLYAHQIGTELLFTFVLGLLLSVTFLLYKKNDGADWRLWATLGLLCAIGTLIRSQLFFLLPFLAVLYFMHMRNVSPKSLGKALGAVAVFLLILGPWVGYIHLKTGNFSLTSIRPEMALYIRAARAQLSYSELTQYAKDWLKRSISGGEETQLLSDNEYHSLQAKFESAATSTDALASVRGQSIQIIRSHFGQYLYGNLIEVIKLSYIEHDYGDILNKYLRAGMYAFIYLLFFVGGWMVLLKGNREQRMLALIGTIFIVYNFLVLTPFDTIQRYNTPF